MNLKEAKLKLNQSQNSGKFSQKKKEAILSDTTSTKSMAPIKKQKGNTGSKSKESPRSKTTPRKKREAKAETKTRVKLAKAVFKED